MKVILGCDPLLMPLTGIGHYTQQLGNELSNDPRVESLSLFAHGKFFDSDMLTPKASVTKRSQPTSTLFTHLRTALSRSPFFVRGYEYCMPAINRWQLRNHKNAVFHSPNFLMPNFAGKTVVTIHDLSTVRFPEYHPKARVGLVDRAIEKACAEADMIVTDSSFVRNEIMERYSVQGDRVMSQHLGASDRFKPRSVKDCEVVLLEYKQTYKQFFLFVSTLEPRKNLLRLLQSYKMYRLNYPDGYPLVLVGNAGWKDESFSKLLRELTNRKWVVSLGYVDDSQLATLYSAARALLFPSIYEGFGLPVLEAMQSGTAVLTSKASSMSEITGESAVLVDPMSIQQITDGIEALHSDDEYILQLQNKGLVRAKQFSWQECGDSMIRLYQALLKM